MVLEALGLLCPGVITGSMSEFDHSEDGEGDGRAKELGDDSITRAVSFDRVLLMLPLDLFISFRRVMTLSTGRNSSMSGSASGRSMSWMEPKVRLSIIEPQMLTGMPLFLNLCFWLKERWWMREFHHVDRGDSGFSRSWR